MTAPEQELPVFRAFGEWILQPARRSEPGRGRNDPAAWKAFLRYTPQSLELSMTDDHITSLLRDFEAGAAQQEYAPKTLVIYRRRLQDLMRRFASHYPDTDAVLSNPPNRLALPRRLMITEGD